MGFFDKVDGKISKVGSRAGEVSDVEALKAKVKAEERNIDEMTVDIGEFYWNAYADGRFVPDPASMESFKALEESLVKIKEYNRAIEDRKAAGQKEREEIDAKLKKKEEERKLVPDNDEES